MGRFDATDTIDQANIVTSNFANVLRAAVDAGEDGIRALLEKGYSFAEQFDALFGDRNDPVPTAPSDGVPVDRPVDQAEAAEVLGVGGESTGG